MIRKPWPIIFMAIIFFLMPIFNIIVTYFSLKLDLDLSFFDYLYSLVTMRENAMILFNLIVPSLVAGVAIYAVKKWSYPTFLVSMLWITVEMFRSFSTHLGVAELFFTVILPMIFNFVYVSYILLPAVRAAYFDPRLRWWETKPRYVYSTDLELIQNNSKILGKITNLSEGGLFANVLEGLQPNTIVDLKFTILKTEINLKAKIVYQKPDGSGHGLQFYLLTRAQKKLLKNAINQLAIGNCEVVRPVPVWTEDLHEWFSKLMKTGKGLVPEIPATHNKNLKKD